MKTITKKTKLTNRKHNPSIRRKRRSREELRADGFYFVPGKPGTRRGGRSKYDPNTEN
jgi:hypothetical protein